MNLGAIYLETFAAIIVSSLVVAVAVAALLRFGKCSWRTVLFAALPLWLVLGYFVLNTSHQRLFAAWHQWRNTALPREGCLTYEPDFTRLYASYKMSRADFEAWVTDHPWQLKPGGNGLLYHDGPRLGLDAPELSFETDMALNGKQLRVYYSAGVMYVSYNSM